MDDIAPDFAEKVLKADVRNTVQAVVQGATLPPAKRQLFLDAVIDTASPEEILQNRETSLLRKFATGGRLKKEELEEIAHLLPPAQAPYSRTATDHVYQRSYAEYASTFDVAERTVKYWVAQGKKNAKGVELPPLDRPVEMPHWWARNMKQKCPDKVLSAARASAVIHAPHPGAVPSLIEQPATKPGISIPHNIEVSGFEENLNKLRLQVSIAYNELETLQRQDPVDHAAVEQSRRRWMTLDAALQKAEAAAPEVLEKLDRYIDKRQLQVELTSMLGACADSMRSLYRRLRGQLKLADDEAAEDAIWQAGIDEIFEELERAGYAQPFKLEAS